MAAWAFIPQVRNGAAHGELTQLADRRLSFRLNRACSISASLSVNHATARREWITPGVSELKVYRDGVALETVFACHAAALDARGDAPRLDIAWGGIFSYLQDALVYGQVAAYSSATLPWTWINTFQARAGAASAITQGNTTGTATTQSRTMQQDESLAESIIALAEYQSGFDFRINTNRQVDLWYPRRGSTTALVLEWGVNVRHFAYEEDAGPGTIVSDSRVRGGMDDGAVEAGSNATSQLTYGRREAAIIAAGEIDVTGAYLATIATNVVSERGAPLIIPSVRLDATHPSVAWGSYWLGDIITFRAQIAGFVDIDATYRIVGIQVDLDENDNETITLDLNRWTS